MFSAKLNHNHSRFLVTTWMTWRSIQILEQPFHNDEMWSVRFAFSHHSHKIIHGQWPILQPMLHRRHLEKYARDHRCGVCDSIPSLGFDGKVGFTTNLCNSKVGGILDFPLVNVRVGYGCLNAPGVKCHYCPLHAPRSSTKTSVLCPAEHKFLPKNVDKEFQHICDVCNTTLLPGTPYFRCSGQCEPCHNRCGKPVGNWEDVVAPVPIDENPCGIRKVHDLCGQRRFGGVLTGMLACWCGRQHPDVRRWRVCEACSSPFIHHLRHCMHARPFCPQSGDGFVREYHSFTVFHVLSWLGVQT